MYPVCPPPPAIAPAQSARSAEARLMLPLSEELRCVFERIVLYRAGDGGHRGPVRVQQVRRDTKPVAGQGRASEAAGIARDSLATRLSEPRRHQIALALPRLL